MVVVVQSEVVGMVDAGLAWLQGAWAQVACKYGPAAVVPQDELLHLHFPGHMVRGQAG